MSEFTVKNILVAIKGDFNMYSRLSTFTDSHIAVSLIYRRIIVLIPIHYSVGPLLIHGVTFVGV